MVFALVLTAVVIVAIAIGWKVWLASKGVLRSLPELKRSLTDLLEWGSEKGVLIITPRGTNRFVQFNRYELSTGRHGLELAFPDADWSREFFRQLRQYCDDMGIAYDVRAGVNHPMPFLTIDCQTDIDKAHDLVTCIVERIFGMRPDSKYHVLFYNLRSPARRA